MLSPSLKLGNSDNKLSPSFQYLWLCYIILCQQIPLISVSPDLGKFKESGRMGKHLALNPKVLGLNPTDVLSID